MQRCQHIRRAEIAFVGTYLFHVKATVSRAINQAFEVRIIVRVSVTHFHARDDVRFDAPNTHDHALDTESWEIALEPYKVHPGAALTLGFNLMILRRYLAVAPLKIREANEGLDVAMEVLFPHTEFHEVSYDLFVRLAEGKLTFEEEQILNALGVKF